MQTILTLGFIALLVRFLMTSGSYRTKAWKKILGIFFIIAAICAVFMPDSANRVAHLVGVKRGADLLLYLFVLVFTFFVLGTYIKEKQDQQRLAKLARRVAILEAELTNQKVKTPKA